MFAWKKTHNRKENKYKKQFDCKPGSPKRGGTKRRWNFARGNNSDITTAFRKDLTRANPFDFFIFFRNEFTLGRQTFLTSGRMRNYDLNI